MRAKLRDVRAGRTLFMVEGNGMPGLPGYASVSTIRVTAKPYKRRSTSGLGLGLWFRYSRAYGGSKMDFHTSLGDLGVRADYQASNHVHYNCRRMFTRLASAEAYASRLRYGHVTWMEVPEPDPMDELDY